MISIFSGFSCVLSLIGWGLFVLKARPNEKMSTGFYLAASSSIISVTVAILALLKPRQERINPCYCRYNVINSDDNNNNNINNNNNNFINNFTQQRRINQNFIRQQNKIYKIIKEILRVKNYGRNLRS